MAKEKFTTPFAKCLYPFLQQPKVDREGEYESVFQITLVLTSEHKDLLNQISSLYKAAGGKVEIGEKGHPIKLHKDAEGKVVPDSFTVSFKTKADFCDQIPTFDAFSQKFNRESNFVANDSVVRVNWSFGNYNTAGNKGVSLFLNGVQVKDLVEWEGYSAESMGFDGTEGYNEYDKPMPDSDEEANKKLDESENEGINAEDDFDFGDTQDK